MTTVYFEEILSDDEGPDLTPDGTMPEEVSPCELPVHTLTADDVAAYKAGARVESSAVDVSDTAPGVENTKENAEALRLKGNTAFGAKKFEDALKLYTEAIVMDGANGLLYGNRAATLMQLGRAEQAVTDAKQMVLLLPDLAKSHFRLGSALSAAGQPSDAAKALLAGLEIEPSNDAIADALKKELARPALKKGKQHAPLVEKCNGALHTRHSGGAKGGGAGATRMPWKEASSGDKGGPPKRGGAVLCGCAGRLWLVGGADRLGSVYNDVWSFEPATSAWKVHEAGDGFKLRSGHAACALPQAESGTRGAMLFFGGQDPATSLLFSDVDLLRVGDGDLVAWDAAAPPPTGPLPAARNGHSLSLDEVGGCMLVFGGADTDGHRNDVHRLTIPSGYGGTDGEAAAPVWDAPTMSGPKPAAREMHVAGVVGRKLLVHGGRGGDELLSDVCMLDLATWTWLPPMDVAITRVGHTSVLVPTTKSTGAQEEGGRLLFFGGFSGEAMCNDTYELTVSATGSPAVTRVAADGPPPRRFAHCAAVLGGAIFVFGGSAPTADLADLYEAQPAAALAARSR